MRWISPAEAEGIVQPKKEEEEEIYTFEVDDQNNLELLNPEQQDTLQNALQENGIDFSAFSMDTFTFGEEPEAQAAARGHGGEVRQAEKADEPLPDSLKVPQ